MVALLALIPGMGVASSIISGVVTYLLSCRTCMVILALLTAFVVGDIYGRTKATKACHAAEAQAEAREAKREAAINKQTADDAAKKATELEAQSDALEKKVSDYADTIKALTPKLAACRLATGADMRRLRDIAK